MKREKKLLSRLLYATSCYWLSLLIAFSSLPAAALAEVLGEVGKSDSIELLDDDAGSTGLVDENIQEIPPEDDDVPKVNPEPFNDAMSNPVDTQELGGDIGTEQTLPDEASDESMAFLSVSSSVVASGVWGTCPWEVSSDGVLKIYPGKGCDTVAANGNIVIPWLENYDTYSTVTAVRFVSEGSNRVIAPKNCSYLLGFLINVDYIDLSGVDTSATADMSDMFYLDRNLKSISFHGFNTSHVRDMSGMFYGCCSLENYNLSGFDTAQVTDMSGMFADCACLSTLNLQNFVTTNVTNMESMFSGCESLTYLNLDSFDVSNVSSMRMMFEKCKSLSSLNLSGFNSPSLIDARTMFAGCSSLMTLDLSRLNTSAISETDMFKGCAVLGEIKVGPTYRMNGTGMFPRFTSENGKWWSKKDSKWFTRDEIVTNRSGIADTYTNVGKVGSSVVCVGDQSTLRPAHV